MGASGVPRGSRNSIAPSSPSVAMAVESGSRADGCLLSARMPSRFDTDTAVTPLGDGVYDARIDAGWWIERGPNGGYIAARS